MNQKNTICIGNHTVFHEKICVEEVPEDLSHLRKLRFKFLHKILVIILRDIIGFENFLLSFSQS